MIDEEWTETIEPAFRAVLWVLEQLKQAIPECYWPDIARVRAGIWEIHNDMYGARIGEQPWCKADFFKEYTLEELEQMPVLARGHFDNKLMEIPRRYRLCLSRERTEGAHDQNLVTVLAYSGKKTDWVTIKEYKAR